MNTASSGVGNVTLNNVLVGATAGGTLTINSNGGSILYGASAVNSSQQGLTNGGAAPSTVLQAHDYVFTATGAGSIGTDAVPIQTTNFGTDATIGGSNFTLNAGNGGAYLTDWGAVDPTIAGASATGAGNIRFVSANGGTHNLYVNGNVSAVSGNIYLASDDDFSVSAVLIGGPSFSGTVWMQANRDLGGAANFKFDPLASIVTSNTVNLVAGDRTPATQAVYLDISGDQGTPSALTIPSIAVGGGGRIVVNATPHGISSEAGVIIAASSSVLLNAGPSGTIDLVAGLSTSVVGDAIGTSGTVLNVAGGSVNVSDNYGNVYVNGTSSTSLSSVISATETNQTLAPTLNFSTTAGSLTIVSPMGNLNGGAINLGGVAGVVLNNSIGGSGTGDINITGPLSGTGSISLGSGDLTGSPNVPATYGGSISGATNVIKSGTGALTLGLTSANTYTGATTISSGILAVNGTLAGTTGITGSGTLAGNGIVATTGAIATAIDPGNAGAVGTLTAAQLLLTSVTTFSSQVAGPNSYDKIVVNGSVSLAFALLNLTFASTPQINDSFLLIDNKGAGPINGQFASGTTYQAVSVIDRSTYSLSLNYAGGDGNDLVATVTAIQVAPVVDVGGGIVTFADGSGASNDVTVSIVGGNYVIHDTAAPINHPAGALAANWTVNANGDAIGPVSGITGVALQLSDTTVQLVSADVGTANLSVAYTGALTVNGPVSANKISFTGGGSLVVNGAMTAVGSVSITGVSGVDFESTLTAGGALSVASTSNITTGASVQFIGGALSLTALNGIGSLGQPLQTQATSLVLAAGAGGIFVTEADGRESDRLGLRRRSDRDRQPDRHLSVVGPIEATGNLSLTSGDAITVGADIDAGNGTITIAANTDGAGSQGFDQGTGVITTTNASATALSITVNTPSGGTGNAALGVASIGSTAGGTATVSANGGSILWSAAVNPTPFTTTEQGISTGGNNVNTFRARVYAFNVTGAGGMGADARPIQIDSFGPDGQAAIPTVTAAAGDGGVYLTDWDQNAINDLSLGTISATGPGNIRIVAANAGGHNLFVEGNVSAASGNIYLAADDNLNVGPNVVIGGPGFSGTVWMQANRDQGTAGQTFTFDPTASIQTSNTTNVNTDIRDPSTQAVYLDISGDTGTPSVLTVSKITTGNGGRIVLNAIPNGIALEAGKIVGGRKSSRRRLERHDRPDRRHHDHHDRRRDRHHRRPPQRRRRHGAPERQLRQREHPGAAATTFVVLPSRPRAARPVPRR